MNGVRTLTYEVTTTDGVRTARKLVKSTVTKQPVTQVVAVGTKKAQSKCDPNYSGCVPIASDVDCAGGSGNGPAYVRGPIGDRQRHLRPGPRRRRQACDNDPAAWPAITHCHLARQRREMWSVIPVSHIYAPQV